MNDKFNPTTPTPTAQETTPAVTTPATKTEKETRRMDSGSIQWGVPTNQIKRKSVLELRREFGENWV